MAGAPGFASRAPSTIGDGEREKSPHIIPTPPFARRNVRYGSDPQNGRDHAGKVDHQPPGDRTDAMSDREPSPPLSVVEMMTKLSKSAVVGMREQILHAQRSERPSTAPQFPSHGRPVGHRVEDPQRPWIGMRPTPEPRPHGKGQSPGIAPSPLPGTDDARRGMTC